MERNSGAVCKWSPGKTLPEQQKKGEGGKKRGKKGEEKIKWFGTEGEGRGVCFLKVVGGNKKRKNGPEANHWGKEKRHEKRVNTSAQQGWGKLLNLLVLEKRGRQVHGTPGKRRAIGQVRVDASTNKKEACSRRVGKILRQKDQNRRRGWETSKDVRKNG